VAKNGSVWPHRSRGSIAQGGTTRQEGVLAASVEKFTAGACEPRASFANQAAEAEFISKKLREFQRKLRQSTLFNHLGQEVNL